MKKWAAVKLTGWVKLKWLVFPKVGLFLYEQSLSITNIELLTNGSKTPLRSVGNTY